MEHSSSEDFDGMEYLFITATRMILYAVAYFTLGFYVLSFVNDRISQTSRVKVPILIVVSGVIVVALWRLILNDVDFGLFLCLLFYVANGLLLVTTSSIFSFLWMRLGLLTIPTALYSLITYCITLLPSSDVTLLIQHCIFLPFYRAVLVSQMVMQGASYVKGDITYITECCDHMLFAVMRENCYTLAHLLQQRGHP